ncbi:hypothetical protein B0H11DRAFT_1924627 [Mycena galericulata]|nr:hypothetical protein B0H11DRAFT_1924627 [Mycena galericulata]
MAYPLSYLRLRITNPAKSVTQSTYRKHLVKAIVRNYLAFSLAENDGMFDLLMHLLPSRLKAAVSHQIVARDLKILHRVLAKKLVAMIKESGITRTCSNFSIFIPLHGDHSGEAWHATSAADHASSNSPMNRCLVRYCSRDNPDVGTSRNMQIACGGLDRVGVGVGAGAAANQACLSTP